MKRTLFAFALLLSLFALSAGLRSQPTPLEITYLANEGFLLSAGGQQVLIDALFGEGLPDYEAVPPATREKLETAQPPFDQVGLILVSHYHSDHFSSRALVRYLEHNPRAILLSSPQVVDRVATRSPSLVAAAPNRFQRVEPKGYRRVPLTVAGIRLEVQYVTHGHRRASIQNLGHIIHLGGKKIL
ncbi:MAG: MBL fold metallo-hydrolase, partial [Terriglobia bacterium]